MRQYVKSQMFSLQTTTPLLYPIIGRIITSVSDKSSTNFKSNDILIITKTKYLKLFITIVEFSKLKPNWDTYNARKISSVAIEKAVEILNELNNEEFYLNELNINVFPMRNGGVQFDFDGECISVELEIDGKGMLTSYSFDEEGNAINEKQLSELSELSTFFEDAQYAY